MTVERRRRSAHSRSLAPLPHRLGHGLPAARVGTSGKHLHQLQRPARLRSRSDRSTEPWPGSRPTCQVSSPARRPPALEQAGGSPFLLAEMSLARGAPQSPRVVITDDERLPHRVQDGMGAPSARPREQRQTVAASLGRRFFGTSRERSNGHRPARPGR
jgi:hypothetical protein